MSTTNLRPIRLLAATGLAATALVVSSAVGPAPTALAAGCAPGDTFQFDWDEFQYDVSPTYPYTETATNMGGSGIDVTVRIDNEGSNDVFTPPQPFPELIDYVGDEDTLRYWQNRNAGINPVTITFSESIVLNEIAFGGNRELDNTIGGASFQAFSGADATGSVVLPDPAVYPDPGAIAVVPTGDPLPRTAPMNQLTPPSDLTPGFVASDQAYVAVGNTGFINWVVLDYGSTEVQSFVWSLFGTTVDDPQTARDNLVQPRFNSAYLSGFEFSTCAPVSIGSRVWIDSDGNGLQDDGEPGLPGAQVSLLADDGNGTFVPAVDVDGNPVAAQTVGDDGCYHFPNLPEGNFQVVVDPPDGYVPTEDQSTTDDQVENDSNIAGDGAVAGTYVSPVINLSAGNEPTESTDRDCDDADDAADPNGDLTIDFGFEVEEFPVIEYDLALAKTVTSVDTQSGTVTYAITIVNQGETPSGAYDVTDRIPAGTEFVDADNGASETGGIVTWTIDDTGSIPVGGSSVLTLRVRITDFSQAPFVNVSEISADSGDDDDSTPDDELDGDNLVDILDPDELAVDTDSNTPDEDDHDIAIVGVYEVGNVVFQDTNNSGAFDAGEPTFGAGVIVELRQADGTVVARTETDANGNYVFSGVAEGTYTVCLPAANFEVGGVLAGWYLSTGAAVSADPSDNVDSNSDGSDDAGDVCSGAIVLSGDQPTDEVDESPTGTPDNRSNLTIDFGLYQLSLGDLVWFDTDNDGRKDADESPAANVELELRTEAGAVIATTSTDENGNYLFTGLEEGVYVVAIADTNFSAGEVLDGFTSSTGNSDASGNAPDPDDDVDNDDNGTAVGSGIVSQPITLSAGDEPNGNGTANTSVDFGVISPPTPGTTPTTAPPPTVTLPETGAGGVATMSLVSMLLMAFGGALLLFTARRPRRA